jgi:hypothetical protein
MNLEHQGIREQHLRDFGIAYGSSGNRLRGWEMDVLPPVAMFDIRNFISTSFATIMLVSSFIVTQFSDLSVFLYIMCH